MAEPAPSPDAGPDPAGYAEAMAELEAILAEIEDEAVDVDLLARRVARAAHLVRWCRGRIDGARVDVERIIADLDPEARSQTE
jgi:exodeoxyribonuclease VII small subunit